jgi:O-antigen/teichoic acid export membrane protein
MIRSAGILLGGNIGVALLKFLRNVLLARLLSVEDFGTASTFAVIFATIEMLGSLSLDRLLIQARDGDRPELQATLQTMQILRGVLLALLLLATAGPLARFMSVPEVAWGFQLMALIPLFQGLMHFDIARAQRDMNFMPIIKVVLGAECATLLMIYPLFLVLGDYRAALFALLLQQALMSAISHILAERRYRLAFDRAILMRAFAFGWPLLLDAILVFGMFQGDRLIVANRLGVTDLAFYSLAFMLTFMATTVLAKTLNQLLLPKLSALQDDPEAFRLFSWIAVQAGLVVGLAVAAAFSVFGPDLVRIVFGAKYDGAILIMVWLAIMQAVWNGKMGIALVALARARTKVALVANVPRILLLPLSWVLLDRGAEMVVVVWVATFGYALAMILSLHLMRRRLHVPIRGLLRPILLWAAVLALIALDTVLHPPVNPAVFGNFHAFQIVIALAFCVAALGMTEIRTWLADNYLHRKRAETSI